MPTIREAVAERLNNLSERTRADVVEHFASELAKKQASALITGLNKLSELEKELQKIKPQNTAFNIVGEPIGEPTFTKVQIDERKKLTDQGSKLLNAINKADVDNDFGDLYNLTK